MEFEKEKVLQAAGVDKFYKLTANQISQTPEEIRDQVEKAVQRSKNGLIGAYARRLNGEDLNKDGFVKLDALNRVTENDPIKKLILESHHFSQRSRRWKEAKELGFEEPTLKNLIKYPEAREHYYNGWRIAALALLSVSGAPLLSHFINGQSETDNNVYAALMSQELTPVLTPTATLVPPGGGSGGSGGGGEIPANTATPTITTTPTATPTIELTFTPSPTETMMPTLTATNTATATSTSFPSSTATEIVINTVTPTETKVPTQTPVPTQTIIPTSTPEPTPTPTATATLIPPGHGEPGTGGGGEIQVTPTITATSTSTSTEIPTSTATPRSGRRAPIPFFSPTATITSTATETLTPTKTITSTATKTATPTLTVTVSSTSTRIPTQSPTSTATPMPVFTPAPSEISRPGFIPAPLSDTADIESVAESLDESKEVKPQTLPQAGDFDGLINNFAKVGLVIGPAFIWAGVTLRRRTKNTNN